MGGGATTVKLTALLATPPTVTTTLPVVAPFGTGTAILVALQLEGVAAVPLNATVLVFWVALKFVPVMVTDVPTGPNVGFRLVMLGGKVTLKFAALLTTPLIDTTTFPVVAPTGTGTTMTVSLQLFVLAASPLNNTRLVLVPTVGPKFAPLIVTTVPTGPNVGFRLVILGGGVTVKGTPLLATPPTVTMTFPVVAATGTCTSKLVAVQLLAAPAEVVPNVTVLVPWLPPKFTPVIVTVAPTGPCVMLRVEMLGPGAVTVKFTPLLATPPTVTTTLPVVAPLGMGAAILEPLQLVGVEAMPLNVTVLEPWLAPKFVPLIVINVPTGPEVGFKLVILGDGVPLEAARKATICMIQRPAGETGAVAL
jgi:hypothetical protein